MLLTRKRNNKPISQQKFDLNERAMTFEGPETMSSLVKMKSEKSSREIQKMMNNMVSYVEFVSFGSIVISAIKCFFKIGKNSKVYFLWADSIRIKENATARVMRRAFSEGSKRGTELEKCKRKPRGISKNLNINTLLSVRNPKPPGLRSNLGSIELALGFLWFCCFLDVSHSSFE